MELFLTGNKYFNIYMRRRARVLGFKLTNTQLFKQTTDYDSERDLVPLKLKTQNDIFKTLEMKPVLPEFRIFPNDTYYNK